LQLLFALLLFLKLRSALDSCSLQSGMIVWRFTLNLAVVVADGNLFDACLIASSAAISNGDFKTVFSYLSYCA
jgi:exosome complex RNA-binding protein Rrp42 (RNase PH superfamily)